MVDGGKIFLMAPLPSLEYCRSVLMLRCVACQEIDRVELADVY